jgi:hypothetical protein
MAEWTEEREKKLLEQIKAYRGPEMDGSLKETGWEVTLDEVYAVFQAPGTEMEPFEEDGGEGECWCWWCRICRAWQGVFAGLKR